MQNPGIRRAFRAKNPAALAELRALCGKQENLTSQGLSLASLSRLERGHNVSEKTAFAWHGKFAPDRPFGQLFELASQQGEPLVLTWEQVSRGAARVGTKIFKEKEFRPDILITFAGPPSLFTSLVLTKSLTREEFLRMTIFTIMPRDKRRPPNQADKMVFDCVDGHRFYLLVPKAITTKVRGRANKRITVIDDTVTTGLAFYRIKDYLVRHRYQPKNIKYVTCVCSHEAWNQEHTRPDFWVYKVKGSYRMPWGYPL